MDLDGSIVDNLRAAVVSAKRLRKHAVHPDTLQFWQDLLSHAQQERTLIDDQTRLLLDGMIGTLETEIAGRTK